MTNGVRMCQWASQVPTAAPKGLQSDRGAGAPPPAPSWHSLGWRRTLLRPSSWRSRRQGGRVPHRRETERHARQCMRARRPRSRVAPLCFGRAYGVPADGVAACPPCSPWKRRGTQRNSGTRAGRPRSRVGRLLPMAVAPPGDRRRLAGPPDCRSAALPMRRIRHAVRVAPAPRQPMDGGCCPGPVLDCGSMTVADAVARILKFRGRGCPFRLPAELPHRIGLQGRHSARYRASGDEPACTWPMPSAGCTAGNGSASSACRTGPEPKTPLAAWPRPTPNRPPSWSCRWAIPGNGPRCNPTSTPPSITAR